MQHLDISGLGRCSRIVLGSMAFGLDRREEWHALLDAYIDSGGNCIDTARVYRGGASEQVIGDWLYSRGIRDDVFVLSKGAHPQGDGKPRVRPEEIKKDLVESLDALQLGCIDMYLLHRDDPEVPVGELVDSLDDLKKSGAIRSFGGSNWSTKRLQAANEYARKHGRSGFSLSSPNFSLALPNEARWPGCVSVTTSDLAWYEKAQLPLFSWSSQAGGFFTGRFAPDAPNNPEIVRVYYNDENWKRLDRARKLAGDKGVEPTQIALSYVLSQSFPTFAIIGPLSALELRSSARADGLELSADEVLWLDGRKV